MSKLTKTQITLFGRRISLLVLIIIVLICSGITCSGIIVTILTPKEPPVLTTNDEIPTIVPSKTPDTPTSNSTNIPAHTDTPEPTHTLEPFPSEGLGMSKLQWEQSHIETGTEFGMTVYDDGTYLVIFVDENIQSLEPAIGKLSIKESRAFAETFLPVDRQFVETYSPEELSFLTVDLYMSESLKGRFSSDWFIGGDPGSFIVVYGDDDDDGRIERIIIATGNNP